MMLFCFGRTTRSFLPLYIELFLTARDFRWGNMRRYPVESERNRSGGAGVYYHVSLVWAFLVPLLMLLRNSSTLLVCSVRELGED